MRQHRFTQAIAWPLLSVAATLQSPPKSARPVGPVSLSARPTATLLACSHFQVPERRHRGPHLRGSRLGRRSKQVLVGGHGAFGTGPGHSGRATPSIVPIGCTPSGGRCAKASVTSRSLSISRSASDAPVRPITSAQGDAGEAASPQRRGQQLPVVNHEHVGAGSSQRSPARLRRGPRSHHDQRRRPRRPRSPTYEIVWHRRGGFVRCVARGAQPRWPRPSHEWRRARASPGSRAGRRPR